MINFKKIIAIILCMLLAFGSLSVSVSAEEPVAEDTFTTETDVPTEESPSGEGTSTREPRPEEIGDTTPFRISVVVYGKDAQKGITWYTKTNTTSLVELDPADAEIKYEDVFEWEGNYVHKATVTGLAAGTEYAFRVGNGDEFSAWGKFVTDNGDSKVDFITFADVQAGNLENFERGARVVEQAFKTMPTADFMSFLGYFTDDSTNE